MSAVFVISILVIYYVYDGYLRLLRLFTGHLGYSWAPATPATECPPVTVLVTVHNEEKSIRGKIENILKCDYPADLLEVMVASDGSTDSTDAIVSAYPDPRVVLFRPSERAGKTGTQNLAVQRASGTVVVFTDAETLFDEGFLRNIVIPFEDPGVGGATGHLLFTASAGSGVSESQGFYWGYELGVREAESALGLLAVSSGACVAVRRSIFTPMDPRIGEDCVLPLSVVSQGYRFVYARGAIATDRMEHEAGKEFRTRVRMTLRNWQGTWMFPGLLNPVKHPGYAFALWSHKLLRWLSPAFIIAATASALALAASGSAAFRVVFALMLLFYAAAAVGLAAETRKVKVPVAATAGSFLLANAGFLVGVVKAMLGHSIVRYR